MKIIDLKTDSEIELAREGTVVAVGNFDGVHPGHMTLLNESIKLAKEKGLKSGVWTFSDFTPKIREKYITSPEDRKQLIAKAGIDYLFLCNYDEVKDMSGNDFISDVLISKCNACIACCGFNFRFGKNASCGCEELKKLMKDCGGDCVILPEFKFEGVCVSSTLIRSLISDGAVDEAKKYLGRPFSIKLPVVHGRCIGGKELNAPTINQNFPRSHIVPCKGVYACRAIVNGVSYPACANVGVRPSIDNSGELNCETHIIGYTGDLYDREIRVEFYKFLRREKRFDSFQELKTAIHKDIDEAKRFFE